MLVYTFAKPRTVVILGCGRFRALTQSDLQFLLHFTISGWFERFTLDAAFVPRPLAFHFTLGTLAMLLPVLLPEKKQEWVRLVLGTLFTGIFTFVALTFAGDRIPNASFPALAFVAAVIGAGFVAGHFLTQWIFRTRRKPT